MQGSGLDSRTVVVMNEFRKCSAALALAVLVLAGCGTAPTTFLHPEYNFGYVERVAVIPLENLTSDQGAGARASRFLVTELLATEAFDVVEPGEVARALEGLSLVRTAELTREQALQLGKTLGVQGLFLGSVAESTTARSGGNQVNYVTVTARMVETDTGQTIWSATQTSDSRGFWSSLFGTAERSKAEVTRACVRECLRTLVK